jgi:surface carbohydrate biosynthesis protein
MQTGRAMTINLYLPITSQPRELDSKLLLALFARERGFNPVLGYKSAFHEGRLAPGFFLAHNARAVRNADSTLELRKFGHSVLVLDEEALVRQSDEIFLKKHPKDAFAYVNKVLTWGEDDFELWQRSGIDLSGRVFVTGNPRIDTMRPEALGFHAGKVARIREQHGEYVLLNTNFPTVNNLTPQGGGVRLAPWALDSRGKQVESDFLGNKRAMFEKMLEITPALARAIAPLTLLIRPHPNEDHGPWLRAAEGVPNIKVVFEGGVVPWIIGSKALIHNNCTTAVESAVLGVPVLNFRPWESEYDNELSHAFGRDCRDADELAAAVADIVAGRAGGMTDDQKKRLSHHIANADGRFACERILDVVAAADDLQKADPLRAGLAERMQLKLAARLEWLRRLVKLYRSSSGRRKLRHIRENYPELKLLSMDSTLLGYGPQQLDLFMRQFPPLDPADLDERIGRFAAAFGRFEGMHPAIIGDNLFTVSKG